MLFSSLIFFVFMPMVIVENGGGRMRAAWASEVFMDGGLTVFYRYLFDDQLLGARTEATGKRRAALVAC